MKGTLEYNRTMRCRVAFAECLLVGGLLLASSGWAGPSVFLSGTLATLPAEVQFIAIGMPGSFRIIGRAKQLSGEFFVERCLVKGKAVLLLDSLDTGIELRNHHLRDKLETAKWPTAEFTLSKLVLPLNCTKVDFLGDRFPFFGELQLHHIVQPIEGRTKVIARSGRADLEFEFLIKLSQFGVEIPNFMGVTVGDEVNILVRIQYEPQPNPQ
ncbi:MAG: YceI family protein [Deltaproteobacteria bacterium]|nr:YceI family protein [Deltaproteobacteria bacterium]